MKWKKALWPPLFGLILLTSFWFIGVPENKHANQARDIADFTLNSKPKISLNFPEGDVPEAFIEPASSVNEEPTAPKVPRKPNPADFGPGMSLDLNNSAKQIAADSAITENQQQIPFKEPVYLPEIFENTKRLEANQLIGVTILNPKDMAGVEELLKLLQGFGDLINVPKDELTWEFTSRDKAILQKTKELYGNPSHFQLGEQCGGEGAAWTYPPGRTTATACGGEREYSVDGGGGSCNTDRQCFGTGFCFRTCYSYYYGSYCYCWVPSCLGVCGFQSYLWDSTTKACGCGATGGGEGGGVAGSGGGSSGGGNVPPTTLPNGLTVDSSGAATNSVAGVDFSGQYNQGGTTIMFDNAMTQAEKDAWIANNPNALASASPGTIIYVASQNNYDAVNAFQNTTNTAGDSFSCVSCVNDNGAPVSGIFIDSSLTGSAVNAGFPSSFSNVTYSDIVLLHEIGHQNLDAAGIGGDATMQGLFGEYTNSLSFGGEAFTNYGGIQYPDSDEYAAEVYALYKGSNGTYQPSIPASADIYNRTVNHMINNGVLP